MVMVPTTFEYCHYSNVYVQGWRNITHPVKAHPIKPDLILFSGLDRIKLTISYQPASSTGFKLACVYSQDSNLSTHPHSLISLIFLPEETLSP